MKTINSKVAQCHQSRKHDTMEFPSKLFVELFYYLQSVAVMGDRHFAMVAKTLLKELDAVDHQTAALWRKERS